MLVLELGTLAGQGHAGLRRGSGYGAIRHRQEQHGHIKYPWSPSACLCFPGKEEACWKGEVPRWDFTGLQRSVSPPSPILSCTD